jgi:hypothetical protein
MSQTHYGPGMSGKPPRLTRAEAIGLELSRQLQWVREHIKDTTPADYTDSDGVRVRHTSSAYLRGFRDALEQLDAMKGDV